MPLTHAQLAEFYKPSKDLADKFRRAGFDTSVTVKRKGAKVSFVLFSLIDDKLRHADSGTTSETVEKLIKHDKNDPLGTRAGICKTFEFTSAGLQSFKPNDLHNLWVGMYHQAITYIPVRTLQIIKLKP